MGDATHQLAAGEPAADAGGRGEAVRTSPADRPRPIAGGPDEPRARNGDGDERAAQPGYLVHLENFEGPLDLLLHLIREDQIEIWEISISRITRQYLDYLERMEALNVEIAGEFLLMAATLMRLKSKRLVPRPPPADELSDEPQTAEELIQQLLTYRTFKEAAAHLRQRQEEAGPRFPRLLRAELPDDYELPLQEIDLYTLSEAWLAIERRRDEQAAAVHAVQLDEVRLEDQVTLLLERLEEAGGRLLFSDLFQADARRIEIAVTFLAALELARQQVLQLLQDEPLEEIWMLSRVFAEASSPEPRAAVDQAFVTAPRP
jgi:segregation and condensation protein A